MLRTTLASLLKCIQDVPLCSADVITWGAPVPSFGDPTRSVIATLGLNPSNREFVDECGNELTSGDRRFHTLSSLGLRSWDDVSAKQLGAIEDSCQQYFQRNPYDRWFGALESLIANAGASYYDGTACHLDLVPFATSRKWGQLRPSQRAILLSASGGALADLLNLSQIRLLVLNGRAVVESLQRAANTGFHVKRMPGWSLQRANGRPVSGFSYRGAITSIGTSSLTRPVTVIGFNHNIQSSFGVTSTVKQRIASWISNTAAEVCIERS